MRHHLEMQQWVPYPVERVFAFFANPENLPPLMPSWQKARIDTSSIVAPPVSALHRGEFAAGEGSRMTISFRALPLVPVRMRWDAKITAFAWDDHFCDEQLSGPFAYWLHCHRVKPDTRDSVRGTLVTDVVTYAMKFGPLGEVANLFGGELQMRSLFRYRQQQLLTLLAKPEGKNRLGA
jgi:ligand-binding SRPBCC domain-containing protein